MVKGNVSTDPRFVNFLLYDVVSNLSSDSSVHLTGISRVKAREIPSQALATYKAS